MSHDSQIIRALRLALADKDRDIALQQKAIGQLKAVVVQLLDHTNIDQETKTKMLANLGMEAVAHESH